jgi:hypothetical protein
MQTVFNCGRIVSMGPLVRIEIEILPAEDCQTDTISSPYSYSHRDELVSGVVVSSLVQHTK